jgi:hypothetical protein
VIAVSSSPAEGPSVERMTGNVGLPAQTFCSTHCGGAALFGNANAT